MARVREASAEESAPLPSYMHHMLTPALIRACLSKIGAPHSQRRSPPLPPSQPCSALTFCLHLRCSEAAAPMWTPIASTPLASCRSPNESRDTPWTNLVRSRQAQRVN